MVMRRRRGRKRELQHDRPGQAKESERSPGENVQEKKKQKSTYQNRIKWGNDQQKMYTPYGKSVVAETRADGTRVCELVNWKLNDGTPVRVFVPRSGKKLPKKRVALVIAYRGEGYNGLQVNPGVRTIEGDYEKALFEAGLISMENYGAGSNLQKIGWNRCARTDKGVHAIGNIISMKLNVVGDFSDYPDMINKRLTPNLRVIACVRVANSFNSKICCESRTYDYVLPVRALRPCPTALRWQYQDAWETGVRFEVGRREVMARRSASFRRSSELACTGVLDGREGASAHESTVDDRPTTIGRLRTVLQRFVGTNAYHNISRRMTMGKMNCNRHIRSFTCSDPFQIDGVEFVRMKVHGDSFVLNQIRKMVGVAVQIVRGTMSFELLEAALAPNVRIAEMPLAPAEGLLLAQTHFDYYNKGRRMMQQPDLDLAAEPIASKLAAFKQSCIEPQLGRLCQSSKHCPFESWLREWDNYAIFSKVMSRYVAEVNRHIYWTKYLNVPTTKKPRKNRKRRDPDQANDEKHKGDPREKKRSKKKKHAWFANRGKKKKKSHTGN